MASLRLLLALGGLTALLAQSPSPSPSPNAMVFNYPNGETYRAG